MTFYLDSVPGTVSHYVNLLGSTYLYAANITNGFIWCMYVDLKLYKDEKRLKKNLPLYGTLPAVCAVALIVNLFKPFILTVDENNVFQRLDWCWTMYFMVVVAAGMSIFIYYDYQRKHEKVAFFPVWMFMIPVIAGSVAQGLFYGISTAWPAAAIGIAALHMSLQNEKTFMDPLTGLYNRLYLEHLLASAGDTQYYGIMLDLNFFKNINDSYGHSVGDRALIEAGKVIKKAMFVKGYVFRFAGDEYVVMLETDSEEDVVATEKRIREEAEQFNNENNEAYTLSFSMGHAKFKNTDSEDTFLRNIDSAMYTDKQRIHKETAG